MSDKIQMRLPVKSLESEKGRIITFDSQQIRSPDKSGLLALIARELTQTNLATQEAAWSTNPTALVIARRGSSPYEAKIFHQEVGHPFRLEAESEPVLHKGVYGHGPDLQEGVFTEAEFLDQIMVEKKTGINFFEFPKGVNKTYKEAALIWAQKYFDFVLVEYQLIQDVHKKPPKYYLVAPQIVNGELITEEPSLDSTTIEVCQTAHGLAKSKYSLRIPSYFVKRTHVNDEDKEHPPVYADTEVTRFMISDIVRDMLNALPVAKNKLRRFSLPLTIPRHSLWYSTVDKALHLAFAFSLLGFPVMIIGLQAYSFISSAVVFTALLFGSRFVIGHMSETANNKLEARKSYDELDPLAHKWIRGLQNGIKVKKLPVPEKQQGVSFSGKILEVGTKDSDAVILNPDKIAVDNYLLSQRNPLLISHEKAEKLLSRWAEYELDPIKLLEFPLMSDASDPDVSQFFLSMNDMKMYRALLTEDPSYGQDFAKSVREAERTFLIAESKAKKMRDSYLNSDGQEKLRKARPFVSLMADEGASLNEKTVAYEQASKILAGVISLPDETIKGLLSSTSTETTKEKES